jgi:hypothetical protein
MKDVHVLAAVGDIAGRDSDMIEHCRKKALGGNGSFAVAYAILRATQSLARLGAASIFDDEDATEREAAKANGTAPQRPSGNGRPRA